MFILILLGSIVLASLFVAKLTRLTTAFSLFLTSILFSFFLHELILRQETFSLLQGTLSLLLFSLGLRSQGFRLTRRLVIFASYLFFSLVASILITLILLPDKSQALILGLLFAFPSLAILGLLDNEPRSSAESREVSSRYLLVAILSAVAATVAEALVSYPHLSLELATRQIIEGGIRLVLMLFLTYLLARLTRLTFETRIADHSLTIRVIAGFLLFLGVGSYLSLPLPLLAFFGGVALSEYSAASSWLRPFTHSQALLSTTTFAAAGLIFNRSLFFHQLLPILAVSLSLFVVKSLLAILTLARLKYEVRSSISSAITLSMVGEFGWLATQAAESRIPLTIVDFSGNVWLVLLFLTFVALNSHERLLRILLKGRLPASVPLPSKRLQNHLILIGNSRLVRLLLHGLRRLNTTVVLITDEFVARGIVGDEKLVVIVGDPTIAQTLETAGIKQAGALIVAPSDQEVMELTITKALTMNRRLKIFAGALSVTERKRLQALGVNYIFQVEEEAVRSLLSQILKDQTATTVNRVVKLSFDRVSP